jgi:hypothetical protein
MNAPLDTLDLIYRRYVWSQRLLDAAANVAAGHGVSRDAVSVTLENALMRELLDVPRARPVDLFQRLTATSLTDAMPFAGIPESARDGLSAGLIEAIRRAPLAWAMDATPPEVSLHDGHIEVGDAQIPRNHWVDRLIDLASDTLGAELGLRTVAACNLRYATIYAKTRHIGPPQVVYDDFYDWGVRHEGFASPFNARLLGKKDAWFYSAFVDTDRVFGSRGSFFDSADPSVGGAWCVDPPFLDATLDRVVDVIDDWDALNDGPTVLLIGPASYTPRLRADEIVTLKAGVHVYEGLAGTTRPLPVDVNVWRFGAMDGFSADRILEGYTPTAT